MSCVVRRRAGYAFTDEEEFAKAEFSDEALNQYREAGANAVVIPFAKGFGLKAVEAELRDQKDLVHRAKRQGLRVGAYIRVDFSVPETLHADRPDVDDWLARGMHGLPSALAFSTDGTLFGGGGVRCKTALFRYSPQTTSLEVWGGLHDPKTGEVPARIHDICGTLDGKIFFRRKR